MRDMNASNPYYLHVQLHIGNPNATIGGRRIALLEAIDKTGSISAAARQLGMSYKGAWDAVNAMNNLVEAPLVSGATGGSGGGGSVLNARGQQLVKTYRAALAEQNRFLERLNRRISTLQDDMNLMGRLAMMTSARNQLLGHVRDVQTSTINTEVDIELRGGDQLTAVITRASAENLGLKAGVAVTALIKASWIIVAAGDHTAGSISTRNRLVGTVDHVTTDAVQGEIGLNLPGGNTLTAIITRESADALGLAAGDPATALFKASSIILAQPD